MICKYKFVVENFVPSFKNCKIRPNLCPFTRCNYYNIVSLITIEHDIIHVFETLEEIYTNIKKLTARIRSMTKVGIFCQARLVVLRDF